MEKIVLGFDFGHKRIGVAVGQDLTKTATPLAQIAVTDGKPNWQQIKNLLEDWQPSLLVVGLPLNMDGSPGHMVKAVKKFIEQLEQRYTLPVTAINEILSTREAKFRLTELRGNTRWSKEELNGAAAQVIVETYLSTL